ILGLLGLVTGVIIGYRKWIKPRTGLSRQAQGLLLLLILTMMGGFLGSFGWWVDDPRTFSWDLPPLAGRMLASAGWAFAVACFMALGKPTHERVRLNLWMLFVYLTPLALAIFAFHLDYFDSRAPITYVFFLIVGMMISATSWYLYKQPRIMEKTQPSLPAKKVVRNWLSIIVLVMTLWGAALFVTDSGPTKLIWVWTGDLLSSRLIGVMLLTIAVGAAYSRRSLDTAKVMLAMLLTYSVGIVLASAWGVLSGKPVVSSYLMVFGLVGGISGLLLAKNKS
ncbi:MAG: hypothetical protein N2D54_02985, partial [Chloroflexota bacterium]